MAELPRFEGCEPCARPVALIHHHLVRKALLADGRLRAFVEWRVSKPAGFTPRH